MLLRTITKLAVVLGILASLGCDPCKGEPGDDKLDVEGAQLYDYSSEAGDGSVRIFNGADGVVRLAYVDQRGQLTEGGQVQASLTPEALEILNSTADQVAGGAELGSFDPECLSFVDSSVVQLSVPAPYARLQFSYPWGCPPSSLTELDQLCQDLVLSLPGCGSSPFFQNCEPSE